MVRTDENYNPELFQTFLSLVKKVTMYYVCKFSGTWSIYDNEKASSRLLQNSEIDLIQQNFGAVLREHAVLDALLVNSIAPNKLQQLLQTELSEGANIYYICRFLTSWLIFDKSKLAVRQLPPKEVEVIRTMFTTCLKTDSLLDSAIITPISANKLQQLTTIDTKTGT